MIKKILIAFAIMCVTAMYAAVPTASAQSHTPSTENAYMNAFIDEFNKECPQNVDDGIVIENARFNGNTNTLTFSLTVTNPNPELTADAFQVVFSDPQMAKQLASDFLSEPVVKSMLISIGCKVVFSLTFPKENNKKVEFTITPKQIREF